MLRELWNGYQAGRSLAELQALCADLIAENDRLRLEVAKLRTENAHLRRRLQDRELRTVRRAQADALFVGMLRFAQLPTTRAACYDLGLSRRRWAWAMALLRVSGIRDGAGEWRDLDIDLFERAIVRGVERIEAAGVGMLAARLPKNGYSGEHRTRPRPVTRTVTRGAQNVTVHKANPLTARRQGGGVQAQNGVRNGSGHGARAPQRKGV